MIGEMDPFIVLEYDGKTYKTKVQDEAGKYPEWNETFIIHVNEPIEGNVKLSCFDEDVFSNDLVGDSLISM